MNIFNQHYVLRIRIHVVITLFSAAIFLMPASRALSASVDKGAFVY